jgi:hypothetical protein
MDLTALTARRSTAATPPSWTPCARMSELGYMHRRVQVELTWFIALSDAGFEQFKPLSPAARAYLLGLVRDFSEADAAAIKAIERPPTTT